MSSSSIYGLNKLARLKAERDKDLAESSKEPRLNPLFPFEVLAFSPQTFGVTHYSDAEPDKKL